MISYYSNGLGGPEALQNVETGLQAGGIVGSVAGAAALSSGAIAAGTLAATAIPFIGPVVAAIGLFVSMLFKPDMKKIATTQIVNQAEVYMKRNLAAWQQLVASGQANATSQQAAEANFQTLWQQVVNACGNPAYGSAGANCIGDRQRGGKWDWFKYYYDPIASYQIPTGSVGSDIASLFGVGGGIGQWGLLLGGGLLIMALMGGNK
jgi:hypothetical protein